MKRKIEELQVGISVNSSTNRIISESPAPLKRPRCAMDGAGETIAGSTVYCDNVDSPTVVCFAGVFFCLFLNFDGNVCFCRRSECKR